MNDLVKTILDHEYADSTMKKQIYIYKRSRKKRVKDKSFVKLFITFTKEKPFAIIGDVVLMEIGVYRELQNQLEELEERKKKILDYANKACERNDEALGKLSE